MDGKPSEQLSAAGPQGNRSGWVVDWTKAALMQRAHAYAEAGACHISMSKCWMACLNRVTGTSPNRSLALTLLRIGDEWLLQLF